MKCPFCSSENTRVIDSRPAEDKSSIRRRRSCDECGKRFTTYEKVETIPLIVIKKDNNREQYQRSKIENGVLSACYKRPVPADQIQKTIEAIELEIFNREEKEIPSSEIGEIVMDKLKEFGYECEIEAESESVTITQAEKPLWGGVSKGVYSETNTGYLKVENDNAGSSFTFNINSSTEGVAVLYTYVTPKKYIDYKLNEQSDLIINGTQIAYESETVLKDATLKDNEWATYFNKIKVVRIELKEGNNTITFKTKGWHGLMMDKIVLTSTTSLSEISK